MYESFDYEMLEQMGTVFTAGDAIIQVVRFALMIAAYVLRSIALYAIAKRRGISNPWLAWIPVAWVWILGSISDQFRYVTKAQVKNKRTTLLVMNLIQTVASTAMMVVIGIAFAELVSMGIVSADEEALMTEAMILVFKFMGMALVLGGIALATAIIHYIAMYDLYLSVNPANAVLFLILSIFIGITEPFFIFFNRNKDGGMPPRCDVPQAPVNYSYIPETAAQEPVETVEEPVEETEEEAPAEEPEAPAEETEAPAEQTEVPAEETEEPAEQTEVPAEETEEPAQQTEE